MPKRHPAEMLVFLPNQPEDRINRHQKLNTGPGGVLLPAPAGAKSGGWHRTPGARAPRRAREPREPRAGGSVQAPGPLRLPDTPPRQANKVKGSGFKYGEGGKGY